MKVVYIISIWVITVLLFAIYFIARVWTKQSRIADDSDFITTFIKKKQNLIYKNDVNMTITSYMTIMILSPIILGIISFIISRNFLITIVLMACGLLVPDAVLLFMKNKENKLFEEKYEKSLEQLSSALKAGLSIMQAVKEVSDNKFIYEPIRRRYQKLYADLSMGVTIKDAFTQFAKSTNSDDAVDVALVIEIQEETGGREAEAIMIIAKDIRERLTLRKELRAMFASTRIMIYAMDILPLITLLFMILSNSSYQNYYLEGTHILYLLGFLILCAIGSFINHRKLRKIMKEV